MLTGSDDTNIRIWKAKASEQLGVVRKGYSQLVIVIFFVMYYLGLYIGAGTRFPGPLQQLEVVRRRPASFLVASCFDRLLPTSGRQSFIFCRDANELPLNPEGRQQ